jgi:hypothetical protein
LMDIFDLEFTGGQKHVTKRHPFIITRWDHKYRFCIDCLISKAVIALILGSLMRRIYINAHHTCAHKRNLRV